MEVSLESVYQLLSPCLSGVFEVALSVSVVLVLIVDDGGVDGPMEKVLPSDRILMGGGAGHWWLCGKLA